MPPSDDNDTEWKEEIEEACAWPGPGPPPREGMEMPSLAMGGYEWSTVKESDFWRICGGGRGTECAFGLRCNDELDELETETDLSELYEALRGGKGGAGLGFGGDSSWIRGGGCEEVECTTGSETCLVVEPLPFIMGRGLVGLL